MEPEHKYSQICILYRGGSLSIRDLESFMDFLKAHISQISPSVSNTHGYILNLRDLNRGIVNAALHPRDADFNMKEAEWQFIRLVSHELSYSFNDFGSVTLNMRENNMAFRALVRESYSDYALRRFCDAMETYFETGFTVEQRGSELYATEISKTEKDRQINTIQYVSRAWAEASRRADSYISAAATVRLAGHEDSLRFELSFDRNQVIDEKDFAVIQTHLAAYLSEEFGGSWRIINNLRQSGIIVLSQVAN